jgi:hypothetical protein
VSLLERLGRGHLTDRDFASLWVASESAAGTAHPHLDACAACRARYDAFERWLAGVGDELRFEADEAFPADRLAAQQAQIARRLETLERPARVIVFPKAARAVISGNSHVRRWGTAAAAAALIVGFGLGQVMPLRNAIQKPRTVVATAPTQLTGPETVQIAKDLTPESTLNDEDVLSEAFSRPRISTLSALDDITPHARDTALNRRGK